MKPDQSIAPDQVSDQVLDIRTEACPMTLVRTRLALDRLASGHTLLVHLGPGEPAESVPKQAASLGHEVLGVTPAEDGSVRLLLRRR